MLYIGETLLNRFDWPLRSVILALIGSLVEYLCGLMIRIGIGMKAWDYRNHFLNIQRLISLKMTIMWGALGLFFDQVLYQLLKGILSYMTRTAWKIACTGLSLFMLVNLTWTAICIIRWANWHTKKAPLNRISRFIDRKYPDEWMQKKFCNWSFIESKGVLAVLQV